MAIKISNLQLLSDQYKTQNFVYSDWRLDFSKNGNFSQTTQDKLEGNDVSVDYDESAIKNSLKNLFNTKPGQRFLFPNYGLDLYQFIFEPISEHIAQQIGERIVKAVRLYEPRVTVKDCYVTCMTDDNEYDIELVIEFPVFNTIASINSKLDNRTQSFIFVETSRNR